MQTFSYEDFERLRDDIQGSGSDRSIAIVIVAHIDACLSELITEHLNQRDERTIDRLHEREGPLSSLYSKIELAYAMGLINEQYRVQLHLIRRIRNEFAHSAAYLDFAAPRVKHHIDRMVPNFGGSDTKHTFCLNTVNIANEIMEMISNAIEGRETKKKDDDDIPF